MTQVMQNMGGSAYNQRISSKYNTERNKGNAVYERCCKVKPVVRLVMWNYPVSPFFELWFFFLMLLLVLLLLTLKLL